MLTSFIVSRTANRALDKNTMAASTQDRMKQVSAGTKKFWKVLATLAGMVDIADDGSDPIDDAETAFSQVHGGKADAAIRQSRLLAKFEVLKKLREKGIVLVDVSPYAIYMGSGTVFCYNKKTGNQYYTPKHKLSSKKYKEIIRAAFSTYSGPFICDVKPKRVLFLGVGLQRAIGKKTMHSLVGSFGGNLLETIRHPSTPTMSGEAQLELLKDIRDIRDHSVLSRQRTASKSSASTTLKKRKRRSKSLASTNATKHLRRSKRVAHQLAGEISDSPIPTLTNEPASKTNFSQEQPPQVRKGKRARRQPTMFLP